MATSDDPGTPPDRPVALDDGDDLDAFVQTHESALVEFYTEGCGICASMEPVLGIVARERDAAVGTINPRDDPPLIDRFDVQSVPLLVVFRGGDPVDRIAGEFQPTEDVLALIDRAGE
ncbi:MAG: thioredoxin family protein [Halococcoides sp.]